MGTLLTTSRMRPELRARVRASVARGRSSGASFERRYVVLFRVVATVGIVVTFVSLLFLRHKEDERLEGARRSLLDAVRAERLGLGPGDRQIVERAAWIVTRSAAAYEGNVVSPELHEPSNLDAVLSRPMLYVRGPIDELRTESELMSYAAQSFKDAFVVCLVDRPEKATEGGYVSRVHQARSGVAGGYTKLANVHRLHDASVGLALLAPAWTKHIEAVSDVEKLERLATEFDRAPMREAKLAASARLVLYAMDEPGAPGSVAELDGERPHDVRVGLIDLEHETPLFRLRVHVDPGFISSKNRASFARELDACALAVSVRSALEGTH